MSISKKSLLFVTAGALAVTVLSATAINTGILKSLAGDITSNGKDRVLTLDKDTPLTINEGVGTLDIGNFRVYSPNCASLDNGFVTLNTCELIIYCPNSEQTGSGHYRGFGSSRISSVEITSNNRNTSFTPRCIWSRVNDGLSIEVSSSVWSSFNKTASSSNVTTTLNNSVAFVSSQETPISSGYSCFYINTNGSSGILDLYSLTISFTCN